jgi:hypothetical protein
MPTVGRVPLDWAKTQSKLARALQTLGNRESGTVRLEEEIRAFWASDPEIQALREAAGTALRGAPNHGASQSVSLGLFVELNRPGFAGGRLV